MINHDKKENPWQRQSVEMMLEHGKNENHDEEDKYLLYDYLLFPLKIYIKPSRGIDL
jgi:hypothetical protein